jgi:hypothetical protein
VQPRAEIEEHLFEPALHARGEVGVLAGPRLAGQAAGRVVLPAQRGRAEAAVSGRGHRVAQPAEVAQAAVARQRHDLVLLGGPVEAEMLGELLVEQAERVRQGLRREHGERSVRGMTGQMGGPLPAAVEHEDGAVVEASGQVRRGRMGDVMGDVAHDS